MAGLRGFDDGPDRWPVILRLRAAEIDFVFQHLSEVGCSSRLEVHHTTPAKCGSSLRIDAQRPEDLLAAVAEIRRSEALWEEDPSSDRIGRLCKWAAEDFAKRAFREHVEQLFA